jgi:hypothetical protein
MFRLTALLFLALAWSGSAAARCPPPRDDEVIAQGGAIITGRVAETGVDADGTTWARLQVTGRHSGQTPDSVRLLAANAGLYTPRFRAGEVVTFIIRAPFGTSTVSLCESRTL